MRREVPKEPFCVGILLEKNGEKHSFYATVCDWQESANEASGFVSLMLCGDEDVLFKASRWLFSDPYPLLDRVKVSLRIDKDTVLHGKLATFMTLLQMDGVTYRLLLEARL